SGNVMDELATQYLAIESLRLLEVAARKTDMIQGSEMGSLILRDSGCILHGSTPPALMAGLLHKCAMANKIRPNSANPLSEMWSSNGALRLSGVGLGLNPALRQILCTWIREPGSPNKFPQHKRI